MLTAHRFTSAAAFRERAGSWLEARESEQNLLLGILDRLGRGGEAFEPPIYLATVESAGVIEGVAFRTPPYKAGLSSMPAEAAAMVARDMAHVYDRLPAVMAPAKTAWAFAHAWSEAHSVTPKAGQRHGVYRLESLTPPPRPAPGRLREAHADDTRMLVEWMGAFAEDTGLLLPAYDQLVSGLISESRLYLWDSDGPVCMTGMSADTPNGSRLGYVYTPPNARSMGYASTAVAELSRRVLAGGRRFCFLFTDSKNPHTHGMYTRLGFQRVDEVLDVDFVSNP